MVPPPSTSEIIRWDRTHGERLPLFQQWQCGLPVARLSASGLILKLTTVFEHHILLFSASFEGKSPRVRRARNARQPAIRRRSPWKTVKRTFRQQSGENIFRIDPQDEGQARSGDAFFDTV